MSGAARVSQLLKIYETTEELAEAEDALDRIAAMEPATDLRLGDCYDDLAEAAAEESDFSLAVRVQRRAIEHGCEYPNLAQDMLGWYLLKAGERDEGEVLFAKLRKERDGDPEVVSTLANARMDSGDGEGAMRAYDEALELAKDIGDPVWVDQLRSERRYCREEHGLPPDDEDRLSERVQPDIPDATSYAVAWFPRDQIEQALARWPLLADDLNDPDAYCRTIEARLREVQSATGRQPSVAPMRVEPLVEFAIERGFDPDTGAARSRFAAELGRRDETVPWPPGRNEPCWCDSGRKYKRCCS